MSILITGSEGFVGGNLKELFSNGHYPVLTPTRDELDLTDSVSVAYYLKRNPVQTIIHCATTLREGTRYPENTLQNNLRMFFNLQQHMTGSMTLINLGSGSEYSRKYWIKKMPEEYFGRHIPDDDHSYAKYLISKYISDLNRENLLCLRIFGLFGRYEDYRYKFISNAIVKNLLKMPIIINQNVVYDYLCINDLYRIIEFLVNHKTKNRILNVTPTESIDLLTIAEIINNHSEYKSEIQVLNQGIGVEYSGNNEKLLSMLGDFQFTPPEVSIGELFRYYKARVNTLDAEAVKMDAYLNYAKNLRMEYFGTHNKEQKGDG